MDFETCKMYGVDLTGYGEIKSKEEAMAMDASLLTSPNTTIPAELLAFFDPKAIEILMAKRSATEIFNEVKKGDRTTPFAKFRMVENTGYTQPYSDYSDNGKSDVNYNFPVRENYLMETVIKYGDLETEESAKARISLVSDKQRSAAMNIAIDTNKIYFNGVANLANYGILNQPNLPSAIVAATGAGGSALWANKTGGEIYNDIVAMMSDIASRTEGNVDQLTRYKLIVGPARNAALNKLNHMENETVYALIKRNFPNLDVVVAPEYDDSTAKVQLIAMDIDGQATGECAFSEKFIAGRVVPYLSHFAQKFMAGVYGTIIYRPVLVSTMTGM